MTALSIEAGIDRLITWQPHSTQIRGFYGRMPVDAGASKFVTYFGRALNLKCAIASKYRPCQEEAVITEVIGDFAKKRVAIVLDDMISSGGTVYELIQKLVKEKDIAEVYLGASHNLVTNSIPQTDQFLNLPFISIRCLSDTLSRTINRVHYNRSVSE